MHNIALVLVPLSAKQIKSLIVTTKKRKLIVYSAEDFNTKVYARQRCLVTWFLRKLLGPLSNKRNKLGVPKQQKAGC